MEPPSKRLRLEPSPHGADDDDEENQDELSMTPAQFDASQDPMYQLDKGRAKAATRLKSTFEDIFEKYGKDFDGDDDVINLYTDEIEVDNGHVQSLESRKGPAAEDPHSSDEEERILSGKSGGRGKGGKPQSTSLMPASHTQHKPNPRLQFDSPWSKSPRPGTYRLSSLAFSSSPYDAHPPFDFRPSPFGNGPIDPVWQAPDLPVQPHRQHASLIRAAGSPFGPFGSSPHHLAKRLVSAKFFLLRTASTSSKANDGDMEEEDDILLGGYKQNKLPITRSPASKKTRIPVTSSTSSKISSQIPGQQPPFYEIGLSKDDGHKQHDGLEKESTQDKGSPVTETFSASHQPTGENTQLHQITENSRSTPPSRPKRGRPKKSDTRKSLGFHNEEPKRKTRSLEPHERRIEIIIPMMKRLFPAETELEQVAEETSPVVNENPQELHIEQRAYIHERRDIPHLQDSLRTTPPIGSHESVVFHQLAPDSAGESRNTNAEHPVQTSESQKDGHRPSELQDSPKWRPKRTREQTEMFAAHTPSHDEQGLENIGIEASRDPMCLQTTADNFTCESVTDGLHQIEQKSNCDSENDRAALDQQRLPIADVDVDEEHAAHNTSSEQSAKTILINEQDPEVSSCRSPSSAEIWHECAADSTIEISDPATTGAVVSETAVSQEKLKSSHYENEYLPRDEPDLASVDFREEKALLIHPHAPDNEDPRHYQQCNEVLGVSEILTSYEARIPTPEQDVGSHSPEYPAIRETTESDQHLGEDCLPRTFEPPETFEDQEHDAFNHPLFSSVLVAEIDGLQLDSDPRDTERSPSPQATELPDEDLSAFPGESNTRSTSELVLRLSSRKTRTNVQHNTGIGRSPSPELGTPIGPEIISGATSRTNDSPTPTTPTRRRGRRSAKPRSSHRRSPSSKRFPLSSLIPGGIDDESDDELSITGSLSSTMSRFHSPFSRTGTNDNIDLPPLFSTPRKTTRKYGLLTGSPSSARTPNRNLGLDRGGIMPPATDSRAGRSQARRGRSRAVHSSPLARTVAERLLSSPTKRYRATPQRPPSLVASPHGTLRRCGEDGFVCERDFCLTCCK
ncbi:hypothetical protein F5B21DRAFT_223811 [Xylaria acuta]|nr:hypothetical protein F5B21DRAFT_223811 [Xylaria acuta]